MEDTLPTTTVARSISAARSSLGTTTMSAPSHDRVAHEADQPQEIHSSPTDIDPGSHFGGVDTSNIVPLRSNRFSVTFPILPTSKEVPTTTASTPSTETLAAPSDGSFLTAIAAQERRVLEIKEELQRAEADLHRLKLQWASYEAQRKKDEAKRTTRMRPVSIILPTDDKDDVTGSNAWLQQEMERRKMLMSGARNSSRRMFAGSKHTRTLSLLTSSASTGAEEPPQHRPRGATSPVKGKASGSMTLLRATTITPTPSLDAEEEQKTDVKLDLVGIDKDILLQTGKKMAMDIKDGIWTFWEDLRQATVGEDMVQVIPPAHLRQKTSNQALRTPRRGGSRSRGSTRPSVDVGRRSITRSPHERHSSPKKQKESLLVDMGHEASIVQPAVVRSPAMGIRSSKHAKTPSVAFSVASSDAFDAWDDSPKASRSSSATSVSTQRSPNSNDNSPVPQVSRDPLPWPNIAKLGPATLRRTASHLMSEWDKLSPPAQPEASKDYIDVVEAPVIDRAKKRD